MMFQSWVLMVLDARDEERAALCTVLRRRAVVLEDKPPKKERPKR